jgi:hypothetical protein
MQETELNGKAVTDPRTAVAVDVALLRAVFAFISGLIYDVRPDWLILSYRQRGFVLGKISIHQGSQGQAALLYLVCRILSHDIPKAHTLRGGPTERRIVQRDSVRVAHGANIPWRISRGSFGRLAAKCPVLTQRRPLVRFLRRALVASPMRSQMSDSIH